MKAWLRLAGAMVIGQVALFGIYRLVADRRSSQATSQKLTTAPPVPINARLQPLSLERHDGMSVKWRAPERPTLLHFWATWCPPCRAEIPALLALTGHYPVDVVAVALDPSWDLVERLLGGRPPSVYLGDAAEARTVLGVDSLPTTYLVLPDGRVPLRFDGARDWTDHGFVERWIGH